MSESFEKAVEAAARDAYERAWGGEREPWSELDDLERDEWHADAAAMLLAALPHLTTQDVPHVAREAWEVGRSMGLSDHTGSIRAGRSIRTPNPYAEEGEHE